MMQRIYVGALTVVGGLVLAACGGSSVTASHSTAPPQSTTVTTAATTTTTPATTATTTPASTTTTVEATTTTTAAPATTTQSTSVFGQKYLAIINPLNTTIDNLITTLQTVSATATGPQVQLKVNPYIQMLAAGQSKLLAATWPATTEPDIRAMAADIGVINGDLGSFATLTSNQAATALVTKLNQDIVKAGTQSKAIRSALGLPATAA